MTDPVETLARALFNSRGLFFPWDSLAPEAHEMFRNKARTLLAQITPALVAEAVAKERAALIIEGGGTTNDSAAWTGHQSMKLAQHYQREFDRRAAVMGIGSQNGTGTEKETSCPESGNATAQRLDK